MGFNNVIKQSDIMSWWKYTSPSLVAIVLIEGYLCMSALYSDVDSFKKFNEREHYMMEAIQEPPVEDDLRDNILVISS